MYSHLERISSNPRASSSYCFQNKSRYSYAEIIIDAQCRFISREVGGTVSLTIYRDDRAARLSPGTLPRRRGEHAAMTEDEFLEFLLPQRDIVHVLTCFGFDCNGTSGVSRRRIPCADGACVSADDSSANAQYERYELTFSASVDDMWLRFNGEMFGWSETKRLTGSDAPARLL